MASGTPPGDEYANVMDEKRRAMLNHIKGQHVHPNNSVYKACSHEAVTNRRMDEGTATPSV